MQEAKFKNLSKIALCILVTIILQGKQSKHNFEKRYGVITILDAIRPKGSWKDKEKMQRLTNWSHFLDELDNFLYKRGNKSSYLEINGQVSFVKMENK